MNEERIVDSIRGDDLEVGVEIKQHFGSYRAYPFTPAARIIARMVNKKTLNRNDLALAMKLGFKVSVGGCVGFLPKEALIDMHGVTTLSLTGSFTGEYGHGNDLWNVQI